MSWATLGGMPCPECAGTRTVCEHETPDFNGGDWWRCTFCDRSWLLTWDDYNRDYLERMAPRG